MDVLAELLSITNLVLCFAIFALVWFQRKLVELSIPWIGSKLGKNWDPKNNRWWNELLIPLGPLGTGPAIMLIPGVPVMTMFATTFGAKIIFGLGIGLVTGLVYKVAKKMLIEKAGISKEEKSLYE